MNVKVSLLLVSALIFAALMSGCTNEGSGNEDSGDNGNATTHTIGSGPDDFWITYPPGNPSYGQIVEHLPWILDSLEKNCVVFVVHKTGCYSCKAQADRVIALAEKYEGKLAFWDLDIPLGGDIMQKAYASYLYDPDGPPGYIALTGIFTHVQDNGDVTIGWHSWEGNVNNAEMESWIQDAIYYYNENNGG